MQPEYNIYQLAENAITVELGNTINEITHQHVMALYYHIVRADINYIQDIIPAYTSVTVVYDLTMLKKETDGLTNKFVQNNLLHLINTCVWEVAVNTNLVKIPVCYDVSLAPDLERISIEKNISADAIVAVHTASVYRVYMLGFLPGFAYMGIVDEMIAMPRLSQPRLKVAAGSVGIANNQTGIYPLSSPGGWNIIGQTPAKLFDENNADPCLLKPGDNVQFVPITIDEFHQLKQV